MDKFTPGPWKACRSNEEFDGVMFEKDSDDDPYPIVRIVSKTKTIAAAHDLFVFDEHNARLIQEAPNILEALKKTTAHLVAAHSLLARGGKKAAPSDKMFYQLLDDYEKAFNEGKGVIAKATEI